MPVTNYRRLDFWEGQQSLISPLPAPVCPAALARAPRCASHARR
jgi:hypothetical protein